MKQVSPLRAQLSIPPLSLYFVSVTALFGTLSWIGHRFIDSDTQFGALDALLAGSLFGLVMVAAVAIARWRQRQALGTDLSPEQQLELNWAVAKTTLPQDAYLRELYPRYVRHYIRVNRHSRIYIAIIFAAMTILGGWLARSQHTAIWFAYDGLFIMLGIAGVYGTTRYLHHLQTLQVRLTITPYHQQFIGRHQSVRA